MLMRRAVQQPGALPFSARPYEMKGIAMHKMIAFLVVMASTVVFSPSVDARPITRGWAHSEKIVDLGKNAAPPPARRTDDVIQIQELLSRWGIAYDEGRLDVIESLFTPDAQFEVTLGSARPIATVVGRARIVESVRSALAQQADQRRHALGNFVVDQTAADEASVIAYGIVALAAEQPTIGATVIYSANAKKEGGVWRLSRLVIAMDAYVGTPPSER
jgi:SnoaL-like domain